MHLRGPGGAFWYCLYLLQGYAVFCPICVTPQIHSINSSFIQKQPRRMKSERRREKRVKQKLHGFSWRTKMFKNPPLSVVGGVVPLGFNPPPL